MMTKEDWQELVTKFQPVVWLSAQDDFVDEYLPSSIDWYLNRVDMINDDGETIFRKPSRLELARACTKTCKGYKLKQLYPSVKAGDVASATMYAHVRNSGIAYALDKYMIDIQYWFFYPYNGKTGSIATFSTPIYGKHDGDWEHVTVRLSNWRTGEDPKIEAVFFAAHGADEGKWLTEPWDEPHLNRFAVMDDTHVQAWSAWRSHASYECPGAHLRLGGFGTDFCSGGLQWGYQGQEKNADGLELSWIDSDVWQPEDQTAYCWGDCPDCTLVTTTCANDGCWLNYAGKWGVYDAPDSPKKQKPWKSDGNNGFYHQLKGIAAFGDDWGPDRAATAVAFGYLGGKEVLGVGRNKGSGSRYAIYYYDEDDGLKGLSGCDGGSGWGEKWGTTGIAFGAWNGQGIVAISRNATSGDRYFVNTYTNGALKSVVSGGGDWSSDRYATSIALGALPDRSSSSSTRVMSLLAVGRKSSSNARFSVFHLQDDGTLLTLNGSSSNGSGWSSKKYVTALSFGMLGERYVIGVAISSGPGTSFEIHEFVPTADGYVLKFLCGGGQDWGDRDATGIAFGILDNTSVVGVTRDSGDHCRYQFFYLDESDPSDPQLQPLVSPAGSPANCGDQWGDRDATGIAFGSINGEGIVGISRSAGSNFKVELLTDHNGTMVSLGNTGDDWGSDRDATCVAIGQLGGMSVVAFGRNKGDHSRGSVMTWEV